MNASDLFDQLSVRVYEPPLSLYRDDGRITNSRDPIAILMLVIDYLTEVEMNGIHNFFGNSSGRFVEETIVAFRAIGAIDAAGSLTSMRDIASAASLTRENVVKDQVQLQEFAVTSWRQVHGDKWSSAIAQLGDMADSVQHELLLRQAVEFVERHAVEVAATLARWPSPA